MISKPSLCEACRQSIADVRHGVHLTALKARIFDAIERAGASGIATRDLFDIVFANDTRRHSISTLKAHVWQINARLLGTGLHIYGRRSTFRLERTVHDQFQKFPRERGCTAGVVPASQWSE
jgi:hypothetical protein